MKAILKPFVLSLLLTCILSQSVYPQKNAPEEGGRNIEFPDIPGYVTLKCDLHMHSVFSDGSVWPAVRVREAVMDGLDAICVTDHLEYQPKQKDIPHPDRNRSYDLALEAARGTDLLVIPGAEITRSMPPGHFNALFIKDANQLNQQDVMEVFMEARNQEALVFWNHPHWTAQKPNGVAELTDMHLKLLDDKLFTGIEIYNDATYSEEALEIAQEHQLTILGNSDVHGPIDWAYDVSRGAHRPVTLVFAAEKTVEAMHEAMTQQRTAVWFENTLVGDARYLSPLVEQSLEISTSPKGPVPRVEIKNHSDADYILENQSDYSLHNKAGVFVVKAHETTVLQVKTVEPMDSFELSFRVLNAFSGPDSHPEIILLVE